MTALLSINIGVDPNLGEIAGLLITWHGVFTALGIVAGVWLAVTLASSDRVRIDPDTAYTLGIIVVFCGIIGARALYVIENYGSSSSIDSFVDIFRITEGGISIFGAIIGGAVGGWAYGLRERLRSASGADAAVFGMLIGLTIGRTGDVINGEHLADGSSLPWALTYSHPNSPAFFLEAMHPAVAYEALGDLAILGILAWMWRLRPKSGVIFVSGFLLYAVMRFFVSFLRLDSDEPLLGLTTPQVVSLLVVIVGIPLLLFFLRRDEPEVDEDDETPTEKRVQSSSTRAERRRRLRSS